MDAMLHELCEDDAKVLCEGVKEGDGRVQECLRKKRAQLSWDCQEELFRKEVGCRSLSPQFFFGLVLAVRAKFV